MRSHTIFIIVPRIGLLENTETGFLGGVYFVLIILNKAKNTSTMAESTTPLALRAIRAIAADHSRQSNLASLQNQHRVNSPESDSSRHGIARDVDSFAALRNQTEFAFYTVQF